MITLELTAQQLDELYDGLSSNSNPLARKKCLTIYLRAKGYPREAIADIARIDPDTVTNHVKSYAEGGLEGLLKDRHRQPESQLGPHKAELKALFKKKSPPHGQPSDRNHLRTDGYPPETLRLPVVPEKARPKMPPLRPDARQGVGQRKAAASAASLPRHKVATPSGRG